jgi:hypothetical protein
MDTLLQNTGAHDKATRRHSPENQNRQIESRISGQIISRHLNMKLYTLHSSVKLISANEMATSHTGLQEKEWQCRHENTNHWDEQILD